MDREELCQLIPHGGQMCLLDQVVDWDDHGIVCKTSSHSQSDNPLRCEQGLSSIAAIEYGAQAMAVHGRLLLGIETTINIRPAYLVAVRDVKFEVLWLHETAGPMTVCAKRMMGDVHAMVYQFDLWDQAQLLVSGRATVMVPT